MLETVKIDSLYLAATLYHIGNSLVRVDRTDYNAIIFYFEDTDKLTQDIASFWTHKLPIPDALDLWESFKELKKKYIRGGAE